MNRSLLLVALFIAALIFPIAFGHAQAQGPNLVPNPSFEDNYIPPYPNFNTVYPKKSNVQALHGIMRGNATFDATFRGLDPNYLGDFAYRGTPFILHWYRGNQATPDYYHRDAESPLTEPDSNIIFGPGDGVGVPYNWGVDSLEASTGDAYTGIQLDRKTRIDGENDYYEYLATKLIDTLVVGQDYRVKFRYAMGQYKTTWLRHSAL